MKIARDIAHNNFMQYEKVYVGMYIFMSADGEVKPAELVWTDGSRYPITKVTDRRIAPPAHVGGSMTVRFAVEINGRDRVIYFEKFLKRWFVEKRVT